MTEPATQTIEIFRAGTHTDGAGIRRTFSRGDIAAMAAGYSRHSELAPVVLGHPAADAPAYGWVRGLRADGDVLVADIDQVEPSFAQAVRDGRYRHVSAALFLPDEQHNPTPGQWALRHVGFLGAQLPAVSGLKPATFAAGAFATFAMEGWQQGLMAGMFRRIREWIIGSSNVETADRILPSYDIDALAEVKPDGNAVPAFSQPPKQEAALADQEAAAALAAERTRLEADAAALAASQAALAAERATFAQAQAQLRSAEDAAFLDGLQADGRALPANRADTLALLAALPVEGATVSFSQGEPHSLRAAFRDLLARQPKMVTFGQHAPDGTSTLADPNNAKDIELKAQAYSQEMASKGTPVTIIQAVRAVTQGAPA